MSHWNYRVLVEADANPDGNEPTLTFKVLEVIYDDDGYILGWTPAGEPFAHNSLEELHDEILRYRDALRRPVLTRADLPAGEKVG